LGFAYCVGPCLICNIPFVFNPMKVPSITVKGTREPICERCMNGRVNPARIAKGLPPFEIMPDAYDACDESELG
jgi:hypothetical protein